MTFVRSRLGALAAGAAVAVVVSDLGHAQATPPQPSPFGLIAPIVPGVRAPARTEPAQEPPPDLAFGAFQRGYFTTALKEASKRVSDNPQDGAAMALIGEIYAQGLAVRKDPEEAAHWYRLAGERGNREGAFAYGMALLKGQGVARDEAGAKAYFEKAAAAGHAGALYNLGVLAIAGETKDFKTAAEDFRKAADEGDLDALFGLATLYRAGEGVARDPAEAARLFKQAADEKHPGAEVEYAIMAFNGEGMARDEAVAGRYFLRAAEEGNPVAANRVARIYASGRGLPKDTVQAARWHLLARAKGVSDPWLDGILASLSVADKAEVEEDLRKTLGN